MALDRPDPLSGGEDRERASMSAWYQYFVRTSEAKINKAMSWVAQSEPVQPTQVPDGASGGGEAALQPPAPTVDPMVPFKLGRQAKRKVSCVTAIPHLDPEFPLQTTAPDASKCPSDRQSNRRRSFHHSTVLTHPAVRALSSAARCFSASTRSGHLHSPERRTQMPARRSPSPSIAKPKSPSSPRSEIGLPSDAPPRNGRYGMRAACISCHMRQLRHS